MGQPPQAGWALRAAGRALGARQAPPTGSLGLFARASPGATSATGVHTAPHVTFFTWARALRHDGTRHYTAAVAPSTTPQSPPCKSGGEDIPKVCLRPSGRLRGARCSWCHSLQVGAAFACHDAAGCLAARAAADEEGTQEAHRGQAARAHHGCREREGLVKCAPASRRPAARHISRAPPANPRRYPAGGALSVETLRLRETPRASARGARAACGGVEGGHGDAPRARHGPRATLRSQALRDCSCRAARHSSM